MSNLIELGCCLDKVTFAAAEHRLLDEPGLGRDPDLKARLDGARQRLTRHIA